MSIIHTESFRKGIVLSTILSIASKGLTFCITILIALYFGTSIETDIYFYIIGIVTTIALFINGSTTIVIIPEVIHIKETKGLEDAHKLINFFFYLFTAIAIIPTVILIIYPTLTIKSISKFSDPIIRSHLSIFVLSSVLIVLLTANTFIKEVLGSFRFFTMPMIISLVNSFFSLAFVFLFHVKLKTVSLLLGLITGNIINLILLLFTLKKNTGWRFSYFNIGISKGVLKRLLYAQSGSLVSAFSVLVPPYLLSGLGTGVIAAINFSKQIADAPTSFITAQFASVSGIKFNIQYARKEFQELGETFNKAFSFLIFVLCPICGIMFIDCKEIVGFIFSRGAFTYSSVNETAFFCKIFIVSVPLIALDIFSSRMLIAAKKISQTFWYQIVSNLFLIISIIVLLPRLHAKAFPIAVLINYSVNLIVQPIFFYFICPYVNYFKIIKSFFLILALNVSVMAVIVILNKFLYCPAIAIYTVFIVDSICYLLLIVITNNYLKINNDFRSYLSRYIKF